MKGSAMIDKNWIRWIRVGLRKYFDAAKDSYHLHYEGLERDALAPLTEWAELRIDGPNTRPYSGLIRLDVDINVILQSKVDRRDLDKIYRISGVFHSAFAETIPIYKLGSTEDDDESLLGCLALGDQVKYNYCGVVDENLRIEQASLLARYHLEI
jgi:hypothetical protein